MSQKSIIYLVPTLVESNELNAHLFEIMEGIEKLQPSVVSDHLLSCVWGTKNTVDILKRMPKGSAHSVVSTSFARAKNDQLNYFEIEYKEDCKYSIAVATQCAKIASTQKLVTVRMAPALRHFEDKKEPNPLFIGADCFGIIIKPFYYTAIESESFASNKEFMKVYFDTLAMAVSLLDKIEA